jgi:hypothetical protein
VVAFLVLNGGAVLIALLVGRVARGRMRVSRFLLATLSGYLIVVHSTVLAAGLMGWLTAAGLVTLLAIGVAGALWLARRPNQEHEPRGDGPHFATAALFSPLAAIISSAVWAWPHVAEATRLWIWDDYTYHMVYPALWLREHTIAAVTPAHAFTMQAWYPLSASVVATWFMLPFAGSRGDALAWVSLTALLYAGIVACGAAELLARLGCRRGAWAVPVILFVTSHRITVMASSFSDADLAHAAALFAAFVFAIPRGDAESPEDVRADAWYAALLTGIAVGVRVSAAPTALIILLMMAWRASAPGARLRAGVRIALVFAAAWAVTNGYWYARNVVHTGNPLYPAAFLIWPGTTFPDTTLREYAQRYGFLRALGDALPVYLNWPRVHAGLAVVGLIGLAAWLVTRRRVLTRAQAYFACGTLAVAAVTLLLLPSTPYSAGNGMTFVSGFIHWDSMRYVALLPILGWVALGFLIDAGAAAPHGRTLAAGGVAIGALLTSGFTTTAALLVLATSILSAALVARIPPRVPGRRATLAAAIITVLVIAGLAAWSHGAKAAATAASFHREPLFGAAAAVLDRQPAGTRVAIFGDQWVYPTFGAAHHLVPVRLDADGTVASGPIGDAMAPGALAVHPWRFRSNLAAAGVGIVVVLHLPHPGRSPAWPTQAAALDAAGGARLLYRDGAVGIWKLGE